MSHVLIVEDDRFLAKALQSAFEERGFTATIVGDGVQAMTEMQQTVPDAVILDILLPLKDGYAVLQEMKVIRKLAQVPVIVASNLGQDNEVKKAMDLGANKYIIKSETSLLDVVAATEELIAAYHNAVKP